MVLGVWFPTPPGAEESFWDPTFPEAILAWDVFLERDNRSRQEGCIHLLAKDTRLDRCPPSMASRISMWEKFRWPSLLSNGWVED